MDKDKKYSNYLKGLKKATEEVKEEKRRKADSKKPKLRDYIINLDIEQYNDGGMCNGGGAAIKGLNFKGVK